MLLQIHFMVNVFSHLAQLNGFSPAWILSCIFSLLQSLKALSHWGQGYGFSLACGFSCAFNCPVRANALSPLKQADGFSVLVRNLALILSSALELSLTLSGVDLSTELVLGFDSPVSSVSLIPGLALTFGLVPLAVFLVMVGLVSGFGFGSFPVFPPPVLALGVVPVLVLIRRLFQVLARFLLPLHHSNRNRTHQTQQLHLDQHTLWNQDLYYLDLQSPSF